MHSPLSYTLTYSSLLSVIDRYLYGSFSHCDYSFLYHESIYHERSTQGYSQGVKKYNCPPLFLANHINDKDRQKGHLIMAVGDA